MSANPLRAGGALVLEGGRQLGGMTLVVGRAARALPSIDRRELMRSLVQFGYGSLWLTVVVATFIGGILVLFANVNVQRYGAKAVLGWAAGYSILREFGPLLLGLVMAGRIGARNAAELAAMKLGGQLEGLQGVGVDPFALLVAPRVVASAVSIGALGMLCSAIAIVSSAVFALGLLQVEWSTFFNAFSAQLGWRDLGAGLTKSVAFGVIISLVSTRCGLIARGGARAVGRAAALAVVASAASLSAADWLITLALNALL